MKIGIVTHYYKSLNYGGVLQAYALCEYLNSLGHNAEQICYDFSNGTEAKVKNKFVRRILNIPHYLRHFASFAWRLLNLKKETALMKKRAKAFENFVTNKIPHSSGVYNNNNIGQTNDLYDAFITGSDQVWNFTWYRPPFFLSFVNQKPKIAYAASIALEKLTQQQSELMVKHTKGYKAISIREAQGVKLLNNLNIEACNTADPTLLLGYNDYNKLCSERIIKDKYMYVYFLGKNPKSRRAAKEYAKQHGLKIVSAATLGDSKPADFKFADIKLEERVSPEDFLSLMKHAEFICTDSFHACVFSYIFKKQFAVFKREKNDDMSSRIINILNLLGENERYCDTNKKSTAEYINSLPDIDYSKDFAKLNDLISFSKRFLTNALDSSAQGPAKA